VPQLCQPLSCRVHNTAADWIEANLGQGPVVKEKFMSSSNWSSAVRHTAAAATAAAAFCCSAGYKLLKLHSTAAAAIKRDLLTASHQQWQRHLAE
jgi:hypothetical protein